MHLSYVGNRVVSPYLPHGRERIEFQRRHASQLGESSEPTDNPNDENNLLIHPMSPARDPTTAYNLDGGNFPIGVPNTFQYPPFVATPPILPKTVEDDQDQTDVSTSGPPPDEKKEGEMKSHSKCANAQAITCVTTDARQSAQCGPTDIRVVSKLQGASTFSVSNANTYFEYRCVTKPTLISVTPDKAASGSILKIQIKKVQK